MVTKSSREMQKDREKIRPPFGGLKFFQGTHYLPLTHSWPFSPKLKFQFQNFFSNLPKLFPTFLYLEAEKATDQYFESDSRSAL